MTERPIPGRSFVSKRAIVEVIRSAVVESYGVTGLADPDLGGRLLRWLHLRTSGIRLDLSKGVAIELFLTVAYGVPDRRGRAAGRLGRPVRHPALVGPRRRPARHPRRRPELPAGEDPGRGERRGRAACGRVVPLGRGRDGRRVRPRMARAAARPGAAPSRGRWRGDPSLLRRRRSPRRVPGLRGVDRGACRRAQRAQRLPGPRRRHRHEHARHRPRRSRRRGAGGARPGRPCRGGDQLRRPHGCPRELGGHPLAGLPRLRGGPRGQAPVQRARRRARADGREHRTAYAAVVRPVEGTILTVVREAAAAAVAAAERENDIETVVAAAVEAADRALARTPTLLPVLREAGVVDAGGPGFSGSSRARYRHLTGELGRRRGRSAVDGHPAVRGRRPRRRRVRLRDDVPPRGGAGSHAGHRRDPERLESIGESVLVAGDAARGEGARPQRAPGRGHRVRARARRAEPRSASRTSTARRGRARGPGRGRLGRAARGRPGRACTGRASRTSPPRPPARPPGRCRRSRRVPARDRRERAAASAGAPRGRPSPWSRSPAATARRGLRVVRRLARSSGAASRRTRARASCSRRSRRSEATRSSSSRTTRTSSWPPARSRQLTDRPVHVVPTRNAAEGVAALLALDPSLAAVRQRRAR